MASVVVVPRLQSTGSIAAPRHVGSSQTRDRTHVSCNGVCACCCFSQVQPCNPMDCNLPGPSVRRDSPGKNTGVGCHALLQGVFPTQGWNLHLLLCVFCTGRQILYHQPTGKPCIFLVSIHLNVLLVQKTWTFKKRILVGP